MKGTRAPAAKNFVATAMPKQPVALSWAMMDQVMCALRGITFPRGIARAQTSYQTYEITTQILWGARRIRGITLNYVWRILLCGSVPRGGRARGAQTPN